MNNKLSLSSVSAIPDSFVIADRLSDDQFQKILIKLEILLKNDQFHSYTPATILQLLPLIKQSISIKKHYILWSIRVLLPKNVTQDSLQRVMEIETAEPVFKVMLDLLVECFQTESM
jgi:hypothetical protein